ncbi:MULTISPECIES: apolipoprotein N-acyltransferase [unclassified Sphingobium]|uniref:apolipoprotein N-acyltransferase n=1 Tax=unclassified Sphingobium TaxID=2611147 RepID=UPI00082CB554|nr:MULTISPECIES: apolipoprotein N-acyltransferase [unclassified Sphingobium]NML90016.1 apolipoprotein N-acyltransferase [Sphingobium sp. TB-6]
MKDIPARFPKLTALLAGFVAATGFEPLKLWPVTLACFALLIVLIERAPDRRSAFLRGWLFGVGHFTLGLNWIAHAFTFQDAMPHWFGYGAVILLSLYLAAYPGLATLAAWWLRNHVFLRRQEPSPAVRTGLLPPQEHATLPFTLIFAATWLASEYLRATAFTGFAWNPLGVTLLPTGMAIASTLIGTYGLGALAILASGALLLILRRQIKPAAAITVPLIAMALWGHLSPAPSTPTGAPRIRVVQPNIGQDEKYSPELEQAHFRTLATLSGTPRPAPRLIFWPEAAIPAYLDLEPEWRARLAGLLGPGDLLMTGATKVYFKQIEKEGVTENALAGANNSLFIVDPEARLLGRYDKSHLVPYGEYLPMRQILQPLGLSRLVPGDVDFWPGPGPQSLTLHATLGRPQLKMGVQICYEIIFSGQVVDKANRPNFLFNPSNDAWFGSWGPVQHLAQARLRAIEEGIPIIRSTPTGISAVVDARGHILSSIGHHRAGFLDTALPTALSPTLFSRLGNWAPFGFMIALVALAIATRRTTR